MTKLFKKLAVAVLLITGAVGTAAAYPSYSLPGIPDSGPLSFEFASATQTATSMNDYIRKWYWNGISIEESLGGTYTLKAENAGDFTFYDLNDVAHEGTKGQFTLEAFFSATGDFVSGTVYITGAIEDIGINKPEFLMSADLIDFNVDGSQTLIGFATTNVLCNAVYEADCFNNESVYLQTNAALDTANLNNNAGRTMVSSLTTVPLPASVWLLGSALGFAGLLARRRRQTA